MTQIHFLSDMEKKCFKCNDIKPLTGFYVHRGMTDGHLNKCKECCKKEADVRAKVLQRTNPEWVESEKVRSRSKYYRLGYKDKHRTTPEAAKIYRATWSDRYPEKKKATSLTCHMKPSVSGHHLHHWSYNLKHAKDIIELSVTEHAKLHRYIIYDQEHFMYRRRDNMELLDSKEKHLQFYETLRNAA